MCLKVVFLGRLGDERHHRRKRRPGYRHVLEDCRRLAARQRGKGISPRCRQRRALGFVPGRPHIAAPMCARNRRHLLSLVGHGGRMAVGFHQQHRGTVGRQADVRVLFHTGGRHAIEEFERARRDARRDDRGYGVRRVLDGVVNREQRSACGRSRDELEQHFGDDAERAL